MTQIMVFHALSGNSTIKSIDISLHGAVSLATGCSSPGVFLGYLLAEAQIRQLVTYFSMSFFIYGHKNWHFFVFPNCYGQSRLQKGCCCPLGIVSKQTA